jgi:xanthine/uracil permease
MIRLTFSSSVVTGGLLALILNALLPSRHDIVEQENDR